jgi:hypothetical protein
VKENLRNVNAQPSDLADNQCKRSSLPHGCSNDSFLPLRNIAELLVDKGLASVVRHKRDDEDRSSDYDKLMAAEQA